MGQLLPCPQQGLVLPQGFAQGIVQRTSLGHPGVVLGVAATALKCWSDSGF